MKNLVIKIEIDGKLHSADMQLPENWNEVPADVFPHLASLYMATDKQMSVYDKAVRAFVSLTWKHWKVIEKLTDTELFDLLPLVDWVFNRLDLVKNHLPEIEIGDQVFIGPSDEMENLRFGEWCAASFYAGEIPEDETLESLQQLAACLYRPAGDGPEYTPDHARYRGDRREKFNDQLLPSRAKLMAKLERPVLQGIYVWFASCRYQIFNGYPNLNDESVNKETTDESGWLGVYDDLRGDPKFAPAENLEEQFLHTILDSLQRNKIKMEKLKAKYDI
jgi:hypothetical protein